MTVNKTTPSITSLRETVTRISSLVDQLGEASSLAGEVEKLKMFVETFPSHYLKKIDAMEKPDYLRSLATNAKTIIDIGVHTGTPRLYKAFNDLPFVLIDPAKGAEGRLQHKPKNYIYVNKAVGESKDKLTLNVNSWFTSLLEPKGVFKTWEVLDRYEVEIDRLDSIIEDVGAKGPFGVKMDIQGFELAAVRGMTKMWPQVDFLICETNIRNTAEGTYQFSDLVVELLKHDFVFFNILNNFKPNARFYDVVFLPRNSQKFNVLE